MHGFDGMQGVRERALARAATPAAGGGEAAYLEAFLDERVVEMHKEAAHEDVSRIETAQRRFLREGNLDLAAAAPLGRLRRQVLDRALGARGATRRASGSIPALSRG